MNPDGTPLVIDPKDKGEASSEVKSFTSEDLERALAKQKEEHDASLEALVQMILATLSTVLHHSRVVRLRGQLCLLRHLVTNLLAMNTLVFLGFMQDPKLRN